MVRGDDFGGTVTKSLIKGCHVTAVSADSVISFGNSIMSVDTLKC